MLFLLFCSIRSIIFTVTLLFPMLLKAAHYYLSHLSPSRAGQHIGQCISSNHPCPPLRRRHHPTSVPVFSGPHGWSPANSSSAPFSPRSPVQHLFGSSIRVHSGHMTQPRKSFPSDGAAQLLLSCSFPDYLVCYFVPPCDM